MGVEEETVDGAHNQLDVPFEGVQPAEDVTPVDSATDFASEQICRKRPSIVPEEPEDDSAGELGEHSEEPLTKRPRTDQVPIEEPEQSDGPTSRDALENDVSEVERQQNVETAENEDEEEQKEKHETEEEEQQDEDENQISAVSEDVHSVA